MPVDAYPLLFDPARRARHLQALAEAYRIHLLPAVRAEGGGDGDLVVAPETGTRLVARYVGMLEAYKRYNDYKAEARAGVDKVAALTMRCSRSSGVKRLLVEKSGCVPVPARSHSSGTLRNDAWRGASFFDRESRFICW